jgi:hypothetical protein
MATNSKIQKLAAELVDELRKRCSSYAEILEAFDTNGWPTIRLSDGGPAANEDTVFIRVRPRDWNEAKDVLGSAQTVYTPSVVQIAVEAPPSGVGLMRQVSVVHAWALLLTCGKRGARTEYWEETDGTPPSIDTFTDATKMLTSWEPDLDYPLLSSQ